MVLENPGLQSTFNVWIETWYGFAVILKLRNICPYPLQLFFISVGLYNLLGVLTTLLFRPIHTGSFNLPVLRVMNAWVTESNTLANSASSALHCLLASSQLIFTFCILYELFPSLKYDAGDTVVDGTWI